MFRLYLLYPVQPSCEAVVLQFAPGIFTPIYLKFG